MEPFSTHTEEQTDFLAVLKTVLQVTDISPEAVTQMAITSPRSLS
jgi:hypothetical protein